jgi:hypothetical protein
MSEQGLLSAIEELLATPPVTGFPCSVNKFLKEINDKERDAFNALLENKKFGTIRIYEMLVKNGYEVSKASLYNHRRKGCRCFQ